MEIYKAMLFSFLNVHNRADIDFYHAWSFCRHQHEEYVLPIKLQDSPLLCCLQCLFGSPSYVVYIYWWAASCYAVYSICLETLVMLSTSGLAVPCYAAYSTYLKVLVLLYTVYDGKTLVVSLTVLNGQPFWCYQQYLIVSPLLWCLQCLVISPLLCCLQYLMASPLLCCLH